MQLSLAIAMLVVICASNRKYFKLRYQLGRDEIDLEGFCVIELS